MISNFSQSCSGFPYSCFSWIQLILCYLIFFSFLTFLLSQVMDASGRRPFLSYSCILSFLFSVIKVTPQRFKVSERIRGLCSFISIFQETFQKIIQPGTNLNRNTDGSNRPPWIQTLHDPENSSKKYTNNSVQVEANLGLRKES